MAMAMLDAGGIPPVDGTHPASFELLDITMYERITDADVVGRSMKTFANLHHATAVARTKAPWRFIWLDRNPTQQARSSLKMMAEFAPEQLGDDPDEEMRRFARGTVQERPKYLGFYRGIGPVLTLQYERVLANPAKAAKQIAAFIPGLDRAAMAAVVHDRTGDCRPDLAFEVGA